MNIFILVGLFISVIFSLIVYFLVFNRITKNKQIETLDYFLLALSTFNGLGLCFVITSTHLGNNTLSWSKWIMKFDFWMIIRYINANSVFVLSVLIGWYMINGINLNKNFSQSLNNKIINSTYMMRINIIAWIMLSIGFISYALYSKAYGGFLGLLNHSLAIRNGVSKIYNPFSFLQKFGEFTLFSSYIFYGLFIYKKRNKENFIRDLFKFIISLIISVYILYSLSGRVGIVIYLCTFLLGNIIFKNTNVLAIVRKNIKLLLIGILILSIVGKILGRTSSDMNIVEMFTKELSFPFASFIAHTEFNMYRYFFDIIIAPIYILPMRIWSSIFNIKTASSINTFRISGSYKGVGGVIGETPVDIITFSSMQGPIIGIIMTGIIWGILLYLLKILIYKIPMIEIRSVIYANVILNGIMMSILYGDTQHIIVRNFSIIVGGFLMWIAYKFRFKSKFSKIRD